MSARTYGHITSGEPITDATIEKLADEGITVSEVIRRALQDYLHTA